MLRTESHIHDCTLSPEVKACWHYSVSISRQLQYSLENMTLFKGSSGVLVRSYRLCEKHQCSKDRLPYSLRTSSPGLVLEPTAHAERTRGKEGVVTERCTFHVRKEARHSIRRDGVGIYRCDQWKKREKSMDLLERWMCVLQKLFSILSIFPFPFSEFFFRLSPIHFMFIFSFPGSYRTLQIVTTVISTL